jgi:hypothetical protein
VPWFVPALAFGVIFIAVFMRGVEAGAGDDGDDEDPAETDDRADEQD